MSDQLDRYFALEAADYLDQLEAQLSAGGSPHLSLLLRLAGGVRGSAQMAGAESVGALAERLEEALRSVEAAQVSWSEEIRELSLRTVRDLKLLVRASERWGEIDDERIRAAIARWDRVEHSEEPSASEPVDVGGSRAVSLVEAAPVEPVEIEALFYDDEGPHVLTPDHEAEMSHHTAAALQEPVPIETLLMDRQGALREALAMRDEIERAVREVPGAEVELAGSLRELFDLLEVAAAGGAPEE